MVVQLSPLEFSAWSQASAAAMPGTIPVVLDVREPWELQTASLSGEAAGLGSYRLLAVPMGDVPAQLADWQAEWAVDQPIACLCHHGMRSQRVATFLAAHGFTQVVNLQGGIDAWARQVDARVPLY